MIILTSILLLILLILGFPMFMVLIIPTFIGLVIFNPNLSLIVISQQMIDGIEIFSLLAVPLFIFAANIMSRGETAKKLVNFVLSLVGYIPGGLAHTTIGSCTLFGAISGSTQAAVASIGTIMRPKLLKKGYDDSFSIAMIINSSDIAALIPPSIIMILYGITVNASIGELFIAGIGPGLIVCLCFMVYAFFCAKKDNIEVNENFSFRNVCRATVDGKWAFGLPVIILGGIYGGIFSPTEAAAVSVIYAIIIELFVYKSINFKDLRDISLSTGVVNAVIFILISGGQLFSWFLTFSGIPQTLVSFVMQFNPSKFVFLVFVNILFFIGCMLINPTAAIIVITPLIYPIAMSLGVDPIHLGIIITLQVAIGSATPPFGVDIFTACAVFDKSYWDVIKKTPVFIAILFIIAIVITASPGLALFTKNIFF